MPLYEQSYSETTENISSTSWLWNELKTQSRFYGRFHISFISLLVLELFLFLIFFSTLSRIAWGAFVPALFFLSLFSYLVLLFFFQTKRPGEFLSLRENLNIKYYKDYSHLAKARAAQNAARVIHREEIGFYTAKSSLEAINPVLTKLNIRLHWKNFHSMKELLLLLSLKELVAIIKESPIDSEPHMALVEVYMELSTLYLQREELTWTPREYFSEEMQSKFLSTSRKAIQELRILEEYTPNNPWIYSKLAIIYNLQKNPTQEILQYEKLLELPIENKEEVLFLLGVLYFEEDLLAKGLAIYAKLMEIAPEKGNDLIEYYDTYPFQDLAFLSNDELES